MCRVFGRFAVFVALQVYVCSATQNPEPDAASGAAMPDDAHRVLKCHDVGAPRDLRIVVGVKTTRFYHATRVVALWETWGTSYGHGLMFVSDAPLHEASNWTASVVVVEDEIDSARVMPYVPPWRDPNVDVGDIDPFALPQLTKRVAALLTAMYSCWGSSADWFLIVDDDTFVRPPQLELALATVNASSMQLLGMPTDSVKFTRSEHLQAYGASIHCGGSSVLMSRPLVAELVSYASTCLNSPPRTTLAWYWDEVEFLGRCVYELFGMNCSEPPSLPVASGEVAMGLMLGIKKKTDLQEIASYAARKLGNEWERLPFAFLHPIEASQMRWLGQHFPALAAQKSYLWAQAHDDL